MAIAPVQHRSVQDSSSPFSLAYTSNVGSGGRVLTGNFWWNSNTITITVADNVNGSWTALGSPKIGVNGLAGYSMQSFVFLGAGSGATTVTVTPSGGTPGTVALNIHEWSGFTGTPTVTGTPVYVTHADTTGSTDRHVGSITTTIAVAVMCCAIFPADTMRPDVTPIHSPFTDQSGLGGDSSWGTGGYGYQVVSATQTGVDAIYDVTGSALADTAVLYAIGDSSGTDATVTVPAAASAPASAPVLVPTVALASPAAGAQAV